MRIAILTDTFLPQMNGIVTSVLDLAKGMADRGHRVYIFTPRIKTNINFKYKNIKIIDYPAVSAFFYDEFKFAFAFPKILLDIKKYNIDILHFHAPISLAFNSILASKLYKLPLVGTYHTAFSDPQYLKHTGFIGKYLRNISWEYARFFYNNCDFVTCPSPSMKKELKNNRIKKQVVAISNGIDMNKFDTSKSDIIKNKYEKDDKLILFVGRIAYEKNLDYLLDSFKIALKKKSDMKLLIVGGGPQLKELRTWIKEKKLSDNIIITGKINHKDLIKSSIYNACDIFATASITETQGITTLEAQLNGLPCVGLKSRGIKDLIINGYNGFLCNNKQEFADAIVKILSDRELYKKMKKNSLKKIKEHNLENIHEKWEIIYTNLIKNGEVSHNGNLADAIYN